MIGRRVALTICLVSVSCFNGNGTVGAVCERDGDCGPGQGCQHQICGHCGDGTAQRGEVCFSDPQLREVASDAPIVRVTEDNGDSDADLVVAVAGEAAVSVLVGDDGDFGGRQDIELPAPVTDIEVGDVDGDGFLDIVAGLESTELAVIYGDGEGGHEVQAVAASLVATEVAYGLRPSEPVVVIADDAQIVFLAGDERELLQLAQLALAGVTRLTNGVAIDGDNFEDFVAVVRDRDELILLHGEESGARLGATIATDDEPVDVLVTDLSGDAIADLAVANFGARSITTYVGDGEGGFSRDEDIFLDSGPLGVTAIDVTRDGAPDLLAVREDSKAVTVVVSRGGAFPFATRASAKLSGSDLLAVNLGGDGLTDVLVVGRNRGEVSLLEASP